MVSRSHLSVISQARRGVARAQFELGKIYLTGIPGVPKNVAVGMEWLRRAAHQGFDEAERLICANMPLDLLLENPSIGDWIRLFRRTAQRGDASAQWSYVLMFERAPQATLAEYADAHKLATLFLAQLACAGDVRAQWKLSILHQNAGDHAEALRWAGAAVEQGHLEAHVWLALQCHEDVDPAPFDEIGGAAVRQLLNLPVLDDAAACELLFRWYKRHDWNDTLARTALLRAADSGHAGAAWELGCLHLNLTQLKRHNKVTSEDAAAIARLVQVSSASGSRPVPSFKLATKWLNAAAQAGNPDAAYLLAIVHRVPAYSKRDLYTSDAWFRRAADAGQADALFWLGRRYWRTRSGNLEHQFGAVDHLSRAAQLGHDGARDLLEQLAGRNCTPCDWPSDAVDDKLIETIATRHPQMAMRIALGKIFGLKRIELLLLDWNHADRDTSLLVDVSNWTTKHTRHVLPILHDEQRRLLDIARYRFRDADCGPFGPEGHYRRRLYLFQKLIGRQETRSPSTQLPSTQPPSTQRPATQPLQTLDMQPLPPSPRYGNRARLAAIA